MNGYIFILPIIIGILLDAIFGDSHMLPHPVRLIGKLIAKLESRARIADSAERTDAKSKWEFVQGMLLAVVVLTLSTVTAFLLIYISYRIHVCVGIVAEGILCYYLLAAKCLRDESMQVYKSLSSGNLPEARQKVSMIVGRDTCNLDVDGVIKATVETIAENTTDGVTAPLFYMAFFGAVGGFFYKAANTMDSMIGYRNDRYMYFGTFAAKLDDVLNYIPARLTALLMILAAYLLRLDGKGACLIWRRDRKKSKSPNAAQTESVCAGALHVRLCGDACYFGRLVKKEALGDDIRPVEPEDIKRANRLMYVTSALMLLPVLSVRVCLACLFC